MKSAPGLFAWLAFAASAAALDNGALPIPLLGWSTWNLVGNRVNETLLRSMADAMVDSGLRTAGWRWIMLDDGWTECLEHTADGAMCLDHTPGRGADGRLRPDPSLFPSGMKSTVEYVHKLGLRFGIYTSFGDRTCAGYSGSLGHEAVDAATFGAWGVDLVKHDYCVCNASVVLKSAPLMRDALNATGRPIVYYVDVGGMVPKVAPGALHSGPGRGPTHPGKVVSRAQDLPWVWGPSTANLWKTWHDIGHQATPAAKVYPLSCQWARIMDNLDHNVGHGQLLASGPNGYNFPDMLMLGLPGCSPAEERSQYSLWVVQGTPLVASNDLRELVPGHGLTASARGTLAILSNGEALAIAQDPLALPGAKVKDSGSTSVYIKPLAGADPPTSFAAALLNRGEAEATVELDFCVDLDPFGICDPSGVPGVLAVRDVWAVKELGVFSGKIVLNVSAHGTVLLTLRLPRDAGVGVGSVPLPVPTTLTIDVGAPTPGSAVGAIHGISQGPHLEGSWLSHLARPIHADGDWTAGIARAGVPTVRTHGMGCLDMDQLWRPCSGGAGTGCKFAGFDAWDDANYDWAFADSCLAKVYANPALPHLNATIRLGHSRSFRPEYPSFCEGPDDVAVFANVSAAIMRRYLVQKEYPVRDFTVWNEPTNDLYHHDRCDALPQFPQYERTCSQNNNSKMCAEFDQTCVWTTFDGDGEAARPSPFYCRSPGTYAAMYAAVWARKEAMFADRIQLGVALDRSAYGREVVAYLKGNRSSFDFVDTHHYHPTPALMPYNVHGAGNKSLEAMLKGGAYSVSGFVSSCCC